MLNFWLQLFREDFMPHVYCLRDPAVIALHIASDAVIALSYFLISFSLLLLRHKRRDVKFGWMFMLFGIFIVACGATHLMAIYTLWHPVYRLEGAINAITALASLPTALHLLKLVPTVAKLPSQEQHQSESDERARAEGARKILQNVLDCATNISIIATDTEGKITIFNRGAESMLGYSSDEMVGKKKATVIHLESEVTARELELSKQTGRRVEGPDVFVEKARNAQAEGEEWTYVRKDGSHFIVNLMVNSLRDASGATIGFVGVAMDVSARKKAEAAARASDLTFRLVVESVVDYALIMLDTAGYVASWNAGAERLTGYSKDEIAGQHFSVFYLPEDVDRKLLEEELRIAVQLGRYAVEGWRVRKDASRFPAEVSITALRDDTGQLVGFAKLVHDVTARKVTDERFQLVVEAAPGAMVMVGVDGLITLVNTQTERVFGWSRSELLGQPLEILLPDRFHRRNGGFLDAFFSSPTARAMGAGSDLFGRRKDGSEVPIEIGLNACETSHGQFILASVIDITDRKFHETQARELEDREILRTSELESANIKLTEFSRMLQESNGELQDFASVAAHDLQEPLRKVQAFGDRLKAIFLAGNLEPTAIDYLDRMLRATSRMHALINDLLSFSRIATQTRPFESVDLMRVAREVLSDLEEPINGTGAIVELERLPVVEADPMQMRQLLQNLIGNSLKFHKPGEAPTVRIWGGLTNSPQYPEGACQFVVKDNGIGFDEKYLDRIFTVFQRLHSRAEYEGTGVGLAICRKIVHRHGGELTAVSAPGEGAAFQVTLPRRPAIAQAVDYDGVFALAPALTFYSAINPATAQEKVLHE
jgi:PAS domain S-box-containing protein